VVNEQQPSWWKSLPGILTAATGFVAALSGLVAGLNQLGVFRREEPPSQVVATAPAARESTAAPTEPLVSSGASSTASSEARDSAGVTTAPGRIAPAQPRLAAPSSAPAPSPVRTPSAAPARSTADTTTIDTTVTASTGAAQSRLAKGTALELTVPLRSCAPAQGARRVSARLAAAVKSGGEVLFPANTTALLRLQRGGSREAPQVRLDSLVRQDVALAVPPSNIRFRGDAVDGLCLRAHSRMTVTLGAAVTLRRR
jgi:hypothetical protein